MSKPADTRQIRLERRSPAYWRVTFDHPPLNIFGPETIPQLERGHQIARTRSGREGRGVRQRGRRVLLTHYDFLAKPEDSTSLPPGATGLQPLPDMLARLSRAPVVSIASIRGRATGVGSELALASDMRFASREKAILSQWEVGAGLVPGGGPMATIAAPDRTRAGAGSVAERRRYRRRSRGALRLRESLAARFRARWFRRCARAAHSARSTSRQSPTPSIWSTLPVCLPTPTSRPNGTRSSPPCSVPRPRRDSRR